MLLAVSETIPACCQYFFTWRLWTVARSWFLLILCGSIASLELVSPIVFAILKENVAPIVGITTLPGLDRLNRYGQVRAVCSRRRRAQLDNATR
jgi:hypothetical protein